MDLSRDFSQLQNSAENQMKLYGDKKVLEAVEAICKDNPSLLKDDVMTTLARHEVMHACCADRCKKQAISKGFCEIHLQKSKYQQMEEIALKNQHLQLKNKCMNLLV